jgi:hypothetical protein
MRTKVLWLKLLGMYKPNGVRHIFLMPMEFHGKHMRTKVLWLKLLGVHPS